MIVEAFFFLYVLSGTGKAITVVGPFSNLSDCNQVRSEAAKTYYPEPVISSCWRGPVVVSK